MALFWCFRRWGNSIRGRCPWWWGYERCTISRRFGGAGLRFPCLLVDSFWRIPSSGAFVGYPGLVNEVGIDMIGGISLARILLPLVIPMSVDSLTAESWAVRTSWTRFKRRVLSCSVCRHRSFHSWTSRFEVSSSRSNWLFRCWASSLSWTIVSAWCLI